MADLNDVQRIALALPETTMDEDRIAFSVNNKGKRKGIELKWEALVNGEAALAAALNASVGQLAPPAPSHQ